MCEAPSPLGEGWGEAPLLTNILVRSRIEEAIEF
jgi:hypothetical protein